AYLTDCVLRDGCPFRTVDGGRQRIAALLDSLAVSPLPGEDGRELGVSTMFYAVILPLYSQDTWLYLDRLFDDVAAGRTDVASLLADTYHGREPGGGYSANTAEANIAINCLDYAGDTDLAVMRQEASELA